MVDGHLINAERAMAVGLVDELVEPDDLLSVAEERARRLADYPLDIVAHTKEWVRQFDQEVPPVLTSKDGTRLGRHAKSS